MSRHTVITDPSNISNSTLNIPKTDGCYFKHFLNENLKGIGTKDKKKIETSCIEILSKCGNSSSDQNREQSDTGIVIGKIQSGKTLSFTGVIALAIDNNYRAIFILAGTKKLLELQTFERLEEDLTVDYCDKLRWASDDESKHQDDIEDAFENETTIVIPILKHQNQITKYTQILKSQKIKRYLKKSSILIFDDEADQASLNTNAKQNVNTGLNNESTIFKTIKNLKEAAPNHSFIQYTATPVANLLISQINILSPKWHVVLDPGSKYTGGEKFFEKDDEYVMDIEPELIPNTDKYFPPETKQLNNPPESLKKAIREFFLLASLKWLHDHSKYNNNTNSKPPKYYKRSSMMIHPTHLVRDSKKEDKGINKFYNWTQNIISAIKSEINDQDYSAFEDLFEEIKIELEPKNLFPVYPTFQKACETMKEQIIKSLKDHKVTGGYLKPGKKFKWSTPRNHILVGGSILDRGFTVENLIMTYMPRDTKSKNQADTIQQRCRFYGYRSDYIDFCRVYLTDNMIFDLKNYNKSEKWLTKFLKENSLEEFNKTGCRMMMDQNVIPTNLRRLSDTLFSNKFGGWSQFEPQFESDLYTDNNDTIGDFEKVLAVSVLGETNFKKAKKSTNLNTHMLYKTTLKKVFDLLMKLKFNNTKEKNRRFDLCEVLNSISKQKPKCYILKMSHKAPFRKRTISFKSKDDNNSYKVVQFYTATTGQEDRKLIINQIDTPLKTPVQYEKEVIFQIHTVQKMDDNSNDIYNGKTFKTIACYIPPEYKTNFIRKK